MLSHICKDIESGPSTMQYNSSLEVMISIFSVLVAIIQDAHVTGVLGTGFTGCINTLAKASPLP